MRALLSARARVAIAAVLLATAVGAVGLLAFREAASRPPPLEIILPSPTAPPSHIVVHLAGQVARPGVYSFPAGARLEEAIQAAGGPTPEADLDAINRAQALQDGQRYLVPRRGEGSSSPLGTKQSSAAPGPLDLNVATAGEMETLEGIGPELARRIVAYRLEHGPYQRVEDLLAVQGIGPTLLERLRPQVTVR
ncbi:MAG: helix-hairpin-helix domain-containing protein [Chloroflexi bacterium]|nr:helix-hairpin-helix domain-containing protein [Chloroflexota bacterium]